MWGTTADGVAFWRSGVNDEHPTGEKWLSRYANGQQKRKSVFFKQISCGKREFVFARTAKNDIMYRTDVTRANTAGYKWSKLPKSGLKVKYISYGLDGQLWAVSENGDPVYRTGISPSKSLGKSWQTVPGEGQFRVVEVGDC
jgi:hypothetical protein